MPTPNPREFLDDPVRFCSTYTSWKAATVRFWTRFEGELASSLPALDAQPYGSATFGRIAEYTSYKPLFAALYDAVESAKRSRKATVLGMEIDNWLDVNGVPDTDYSRLVQQYFSDIQQLNALTASRGPVDEFMMSLHCHEYVATFELGAKRLVKAAEMLEGVEIPDVGGAIGKLRSRGYSDLVKSFDNKLRNGIAHNNYVVSAGSPPTIDYANIAFDRRTGTKTVQSFSATFQDVQGKTVDLMWCMMAGMYVHAERYVDVVRGALAAVI